jgi:hypothetical protein
MEGHIDDAKLKEVVCQLLDIDDKYGECVLILLNEIQSKRPAAGAMDEDESAQIDPAVIFRDCSDFEAKETSIRNLCRSLGLQPLLRNSRRDKSIWRVPPPKEGEETKNLIEAVALSAFGVTEQDIKTTCGLDTGDGYCEHPHLSVQFLKKICMENPSIVDDVRPIVEALDEGECVVLEGLHDPKMKSLLYTLFFSMGLNLKVEKNDDGTSNKGFSRSDKALVSGLRLSDIFNRTVTDCIDKRRPAKAPSVRPTKGPMLPPSDYKVSSEATKLPPDSASSSEDDDNFGPRPVGAAVAEELARQERLMKFDGRSDAKRKKRKREKREWNKINGRPINEGSDGSDMSEDDEREGNAQTSTEAIDRGVREEWMMVPPPKKDLSAILQMDPDSLQKPRTFSNNKGTDEPRDLSMWTATPKDRQKLIQKDIEGDLIGGRNSEVIVVPKTGSDESRMAGLMLKVKQNRGKSLMEEHLEKSKGSAKDTGKTQVKRWNRESYMSQGAGSIDRRAVEEMVNKASELGSRFSSGR